MPHLNHEPMPTAVLDLIEEMCSEIELNETRFTEKEASTSQFGAFASRIYMLIHAHRITHSCYKVHERWRNVKP